MIKRQKERAAPIDFISWCLKSRFDPIFSFSAMERRKALQIKRMVIVT